MGINIKGTNVIVEIVESNQKPEIMEQEPCNIISDKEGVITKIITKEGTANVENGNIVKKGSVLVNGWMEGKYTPIRYVHANAEIEAKVWYSEKEKIMLKQMLNEKTGKEEKKYEISINNFKINLYKTVTNFKTYDTILEVNKLKISDNLYLPIKITKKTNYELKEVEKTYEIEEAKLICEEKLRKKIEEQIENKDNIINTQVNYKEENEYVEMEIIYEVLESIGTKEKNR